MSKERYTMEQKEAELFSEKKSLISLFNYLFQNPQLTKEERVKALEELKRLCESLKK